MTSVNDQRRMPVMIFFGHVTNNRDTLAVVTGYCNHSHPVTIGTVATSLAMESEVMLSKT